MNTQSATYSSTVTITESAPTHLVLPLKFTPAQKVGLLVERVQKIVQTLPQQYQDEVLKPILEWESSFFSSYQMESPVDIEREDAAHSLLFLQVNNIEYITFNYAQNIMEKVEWLKIYNELTSIVTSILPSNTNVKEFIDTDKGKQLEIQLRYKIALKIMELKESENATFEQLVNQIYESVDQAIADMQIQFDMIEQLMIDLNDQRAFSTIELHEEIDTLTTTAKEIYQVVEKQLKDTKDLGSRIRKQEVDMQRMLNECESLISKI